MATFIAPVVAIGSSVLLSLIPSGQKREGLDDLTSPKSNFTNIPRIWGTVRVTGNRIWQTDRIERSQNVGKGLGSRGREFTYFGNFAYLFCRGPIIRFNRVWANKKLIISPDGDAETIANSNSLIADYFRFYVGTETQEPDSLIESTRSDVTDDGGLPPLLDRDGDNDPSAAIAESIHIARYGISNFQRTEAYRGRAYFVCEEFPLEEFGNDIPSMDAEIVAHENLTADVVCQDLLLDNGFLTASDIDVSEIASIPVRGFVSNSNQPAIQVLEDFCKLKRLDIIKNDKIRIVPKGRSRSIISVPASFTSTIQYGQQREPDNYLQSLKNPIARPTQLEVKYFNAEDDYLEGNVITRRQASTHVNPESLNYPIVFTPSEAQDWADQELALRWTEDTREVTFNLPPSQLGVEAGDVISIPTSDGGAENIELTRVDIGANLLIRCTGRLYDVEPIAVGRGQDSSNYFEVTISGLTISIPLGTTAVEGVATAAGTVLTEGSDYTVDLENSEITVDPSVGNVEAIVSIKQPVIQPAEDINISAQGDTLLRVLDIPLVKDTDSEGLYIAANGGSNWRSCTLFVSEDNVRFEQRAVISGRSITGTCNSQLLPKSRYLKDTTSTLIVTLDFGGHPLESIDQSGINQGLNLALVGNEIIQFDTATLISGNQWEISGLFRGRRGTEGAIATHGLADRFILLTGTGARTTIVSDDPSLIGRNLWFKAVTEGQNIDDITATQITVAGNAFKPRTPDFIELARDDLSGDLTVKLNRRVRRFGNWSGGLGITVPTNEAQVRFEILNGGTVVRSTLANTDQFVYTSASQVADFGSNQTQIRVRARQVNTQFGQFNGDVLDQILVANRVTA